jgi:hypothetical protein
MTHLENLTMQLQYAEQNFGENDPTTQALRRDVEEMKQGRLSSATADRTQDEGESELLSFHVGFRKKQG